MQKSLGKTGAELEKNCTDEWGPAGQWHYSALASRSFLACRKAMMCFHSCCALKDYEWFFRSGERARKNVKLRSSGAVDQLSARPSFPMDHWSKTGRDTATSSFSTSLSLCLSFLCLIHPSPPSISPSLYILPSAAFWHSFHLSSLSSLEVIYQNEGGLQMWIHGCCLVCATGKIRYRMFECQEIFIEAL